MDAEQLDIFFKSYMTTALWSSTDESDESGGDPMDDNYTTEDIDRDTKDSMLKDCSEFIQSNVDDLAGIDAEQAGHDFWLTRNGHGAGFWDRDLGEVGDRLTEACKKFGECHLCICKNEYGDEEVSLL